MASADFRFHDGETIPIHWNPSGAGQVYLTIVGGPLFARLYLLEDDGFFELEVDSLGLGMDPIELEFTVSRWDRSLVSIRGNELEIAATSEVSFTRSYHFTAGRTAIEMEDTCKLAHDLPCWSRAATGAS